MEYIHKIAIEKKKKILTFIYRHCIDAETCNGCLQIYFQNTVVALYRNTNQLLT